MAFQCIICVSVRHIDVFSWYEYCTPFIVDGNGSVRTRNYRQTPQLDRDARCTIYSRACTRTSHGTRLIRPKRSVHPE